MSDKAPLSLAVPKVPSAIVKLKSSALSIGASMTLASPATDVAGEGLGWGPCCGKTAVETVDGESPFAVFDCLEAHIASML